MSDAAETLILRANSERWADTLVDVSPLDVLSEEVAAEVAREEPVPSARPTLARPAASSEAGWRGPLLLFALALGLFTWALRSTSRDGAAQAAPSSTEGAAPLGPVVRPLPAEEQGEEQTEAPAELELELEVDLSRQRSDPPSFDITSGSVADARATAARALFEGRPREGARLYRALPVGAVEPELLELLLQLLDAPVEP